MNFPPRYRDYLAKKIEAFKLIHEELIKRERGSHKELEMGFAIKMLEHELKTMNMLRDDNDE